MPKITESFQIAQDAARVWAFFQNIPEVVTCLPGLSLTGQPAPEVFQGQIKVKLGAVSAAFEGEATILETDPVAYSARIKGKGIDKKGGSRAQAEFTYQLVPGDLETRVIVNADITLSGPLAQFGRTGILNDVAREMTAQFAANLEAKLRRSAPPDSPENDAVRPSAVAAATELSVRRLVLVMLRGRWRAAWAVVTRLFTR